MQNLVQDQFPLTSQTNTNELKTQLANMRYQFVNLAKKLVHHHHPALPESLMQMLNQAPPVLSLDNIWDEKLPAKYKSRE